MPRRPSRRSPSRPRPRSDRRAAASAAATWEAVRIPYASRRLLKPLHRGSSPASSPPPRAGWLALLVGPAGEPCDPVFVETPAQAAAALVQAFGAAFERGGHAAARVRTGDAALAEALSAAGLPRVRVHHADRLPRVPERLESLQLDRLLRTDAATARLGPRFPAGVGFDPDLQGPVKIEGGFVDPMMGAS